MCLITFAYKAHPSYSLILLANRDEFYARPTKPMHYWPTHENILAGQDLKQGGTWLGFSKQGKLAAVTNFRDGLAVKENVLSRGDLTRAFLESATNANAYLEDLLAKQQAFGDYNLILGDASGLYYHSNREGIIHNLQPGIYGLSNALLDSSWPKTDQVKAALAQVLRQETLDSSELIAIMKDQAQAKTSKLPNTHISLEWEKRLSACFIQTEDYGTRATSLVLQKPNGATQVIEQSYNAHGKERQRSFALHTPAVGGLQG